MQRLSLILSIVFAAGAGIGGLINLPGPWTWLAALLAAAGALAALLLGGGRDHDDDHAATEPVRSIPTPVNRPTASRPVRHADDGHDDDVHALRAELEKHKQLERELVAAKQAAEAAMMSKGEFLATMSHEIRTPLNGIIPLLDILLGSPLKDDQREYVRTAFQSARQLLRIVDDILDYSKLDANKLTLETVGLNLRELLEAVMRLMEKQAEAKSLALKMEIDPSVRLAVRGDPVRLRQVLTNLLSNAVKFTDRGRIDLKVSRLGETHDSHLLRFEVRDTGIGLSETARGRLFQPFSQADASTTRTFGGTGLGLVICKRIVDLMGGRIGVESSEGRGSLFWFEVPVLKAVGDISNSRRELNGARCLVLTSDPAMERRLMGALPTWGITPIHVSTTQEALGKLRASSTRGASWAFDLLIADLASVRTTAVALHRTVTREASLSQLKVAWLEDDSGNPVNLEPDARMRFITRASSDIELRQRLTGLIEVNTETPSSPSDTSELDSTSAMPSVTSGEKLHGHVLLVEDNPVNRQVAHRLLSLSGLTLDVAENGKEALERLQEGRYQAVLMDCQMPVMDGYTATRKRRESEQRLSLPRMPIIAMTANAMVGDRDKCLQAGMDDYLSKPLNRALLEKTLRHWLEGKAKPAPATDTGAAANAAESTAKRPRLVAVESPPEAPASPSTVAAPGPAAARTLPVVDADNSEPALQADIVADLREIMGVEFASLVTVFLEDAPRAIIQLESAALAEDNAGLIGPAHSLKSTSANLGAMRMSELAKTIEHGARQSQLQDPGRHVAALAAEFGRVEAALRATVGSAA